MAYDEYLSERIKRAFEEKGIPVEAKKMMGGICYLVDEKMCAGVTNNHLMARIGPDAYNDALERKGCRPMDFTGRPMKGWVMVGVEGFKKDDQLKTWLKKAKAFAKKLPPK